MDEAERQRRQIAFDFPDEPEEPKVPPRGEPSRPVRVPKHHSTSICHYCGQRVPAWTTNKTPQVDDQVSWTAMAPYHAPTCRWVVTRGLRLDAGSTP